MIRFGSLFSGIGGIDLGLERAGMECRWQVEIDPWCRKVLAKHWPDVKRYEDVRDVGEDHLEPVDLIAGGFPCQDVSVAGRREGLAGERSGLWFEFHRVLAETRPRWVVIENVPGLLSSHKGRDFATVLQGLVELGYGVCWRILDAQHFGVAQRRRRVFIVGSLGDGRAAEVLLEPDCLRRDSAKGKAPGEGVAGAITKSLGSGGPDAAHALNGWMTAATLGPGSHGQRYDLDTEMYVTAFKPSHFTRGRDGAPAGIVPPLSADADKGDQEPVVFEPRFARNGRGAPDVVVPPLKAESGKSGKGDGAPVVLAVRTANTGANGHGVAVEVAHTLDGAQGQAVAIAENQRGELRTSRISAQITAGGGKPGQGYAAALTPLGVRRLTPTECERLQGFPDGWTEGESDSARYRMLGNAVCVPVAEHIGRLILEAAK